MELEFVQRVGLPGRNGLGFVLRVLGDENFVVYSFGGVQECLFLLLYFVVLAGVSL